MTTNVEHWRAQIRQLPALAAHADAIAALVTETIAIVPRPAKAADRKLGASRLGGLPDAAPGFSWP
ncbi:MAG: hypothetical protein M3619_31090, partial [Myxococcota bacterium]|nr:hypothetical protein [Myxococcota bacterium]